MACICGKVYVLNDVYDHSTVVCVYGLLCVMCVRAMLVLYLCVEAAVACDVCGSCI